MTAIADRLALARRVVVKIGSALLVDDATGAVHRPWLGTLAADIAVWRAAGRELLVVSSGAIAVGRAPLGLDGAVLRLEEKQAAAAAGQILLAHAYKEALAPHGISVGQVLLTIDDTENRRRYLNARNTLDTLLRLGALPVINENDTVATGEIRFGDNDRLAARVAAMVSADLLILLSDIDGLYTADPRSDPDARHLPDVARMTPAIQAMGGAPGSGHGSGGMATKLLAARIATEAGAAMAISRGTVAHPLEALAAGARCTWFHPQGSPRSARKRWIAGSLQPLGALTVDDGAARALGRGRSLLPAGVVAVEGRFQRGDAVLVRDRAGRVLGRGLSAYGDDDARRIIGRRSAEVAAVLGFSGRDEIIHRDDLVVLDPPTGAAYLEGSQSGAPAPPDPGADP